MLRKVAVSLFVAGLIFLAGFSALPIKAQAVSEPLIPVLASERLAPTISYPVGLVQPRMEPSYNFNTNGSLFFANNYGGNASFTPSPSAMLNPVLSKNSSHYEYSRTALGCTLKLSYKITNPFNIKQSISALNCPIGSFSFTLKNTNPESATSNTCFVQFKTIIYSWCNDIFNGVTLTKSVTARSITITITTTASNWSIDPSIIQSSACAKNVSAGTTLDCAYPSNVTNGNILVIGCQDGSGAGSLSVSDTAGFSFTNRLATTINVASSKAYYWSATASSTSAETITCTTTQASQAMSLYIFEINGYATASIKTAQADGTSTTASVASQSFGTNSFLLGMVDDGSVTYTAGTGFTKLDGTTGGGFDTPQASEYSATVSSPSTIPMTLSLSANWGYAVIIFDTLQPIVVSWNIAPSLVNAGELLLNVGGVITTILSSSTISYTSSTVVTITAIPFGDRIFHSIISSPTIAVMTEYNPTNTWTISPSATTAETTSVTGSFVNSIQSASTASSASIASTALTASTASTPLIVSVETPNYSLAIFLMIIVVVFMGIVILASRRK